MFAQIILCRDILNSAVYRQLFWRFIKLILQIMLLYVFICSLCYNFNVFKIKYAKVNSAYTKTDFYHFYSLFLIPSRFYVLDTFLYIILPSFY